MPTNPAPDLALNLNEIQALIWERLRHLIEPPSILDTTFREFDLIDVDGPVWTFAVKDTFKAQVIKLRYGDAVLSAVNAVIAEILPDEPRASQVRILGQVPGPPRIGQASDNFLVDPETGESFQLRSGKREQDPPRLDELDLEEAVQTGAAQALVADLARQLNIDHEPEEEAYSPFSGFEPLQSNFTQVPNSFFTWVVPRESGAVVKLVATVLIQTVGTFIDLRNHHRRDEWPVNNRIAREAAGLSVQAYKAALWDSRARGYVISRIPEEEELSELRRQTGAQIRYTLRVRFPEDEIDEPKSNRPVYGSAD